MAQLASHAAPVAYSLGGVDRNGPTTAPSCGNECVVCMSLQAARGACESVGAKLVQQLAASPKGPQGRFAGALGHSGDAQARAGQQGTLPQEERCHLLEYIGLLEQQRRRLYEQLACALAELEEERRQRGAPVATTEAALLLQAAEGRGAQARAELEQQLALQRAELEAERRRHSQEVAALRARMQEERAEQERRLSFMEAERGQHMAQAAELEAQRRRLDAQVEDLALERRSFALQVSELEAKRRQWAARGAELDAAERSHAQQAAQHAAHLDLTRRQHAELASRLEASELENERKAAELHAAQQAQLSHGAELEALRRQHAQRVSRELEELEAARRRHARDAEDLESQRRLHAEELQGLELRRSCHAKESEGLEAERARHAEQRGRELAELAEERRSHAARILSDISDIERQRAELRIEKMSSIICQWRHCILKEKEVSLATDWSKQTFVDITEEHGEVSMKESPPRALEVALQSYFGQQCDDEGAFTQLSQQQIASMVASMAPSTYREGDVVIRQGDPGSEFFLVEGGSLQVIVDGQYSSTLRTCDAFGDRALLNDEPRAATVKVVSATAKLWSMDRATFEKHSRLKLAACVAGLIQRGLPVFRNLSKAHAESMMSSAKLRVYRMDEVVVRQGDKGDAFFVIERGALHVIKDASLVRSLQSGECFGELALLNDEERASTVQVISETAELWVIGREDFLRHSQHMLRASLDALSRSPTLQDLCQDWSQDDFDGLMCRARLHIYHRGQDVVQQGEDGLTFFAIEMGTLSVIIDGEEAGTMERGESFGETALVRGGKRAATVRVASDLAELWTVSRTDFMELSSKKK